jgi:aryl-alcohol dehydrogenase-like predicted oxidoreductase
MALRKLGNTGIEVSPIALGGNVFGWTVDEATSFQLLDSWVASGFNFIDTADVYSNWVPGHPGGESETIIGNWMKLRGNRKKVVIATKVGHEMSPDKKGLKRDYIIRACEDSLKRLQTDYIDLYQSHKDDPNTPQEEVLATYGELIKQGKVRAIGASNFTAERLGEALQISAKHGYPAYQTLQPLYNLYDRSDYEANLEHLCREKKLAVIPYFSLAAGFLTGKYRSEEDLAKSPRGERVKRYLDDRGFRILKTLDTIAQQIDSTPGKIAIAWLLARHSITAPIASATNQIQLHDLIAATKLKLAQSHIEMLNH